ncbi:MAG: ActS/PrrB/RegB family redox-sensitive histidine kinase [Caulobacterales bacterium]|nr:ActS/PrrB/RegB family redox-sensitive histidine kinase [Caulobacterales bacterium]
MSDHALPPTDARADPAGAAVERRVRLRTLLMLRWLAVIGQTTTVLIVQFGLGFDVDLPAVLAVISASAWLNIVLTVMLPAQRLLSDAEAAAQLIFDVGQLAWLLALTGGIANPFVVLLGAPVVIAAVALRGPFAVAIAALAVIATGCMALWSRPLPWYAGEAFTAPPVYVLGLWMALVSGAGFMSVFAWRAARDARRMSAALTATEAILARQERLSALGGLAAAAAHELGTPLGTIQVVAKEIARNAPDGSELADDAGLLMSQAARCREILRQLARRGAEEDAVHARLNFHALLEEAAEPLRSLGKTITIVMEPPPGADPPRPPDLRRLPEMAYAIGNYLENAVDFAVREAVLIGRWNEGWLEVEVRDDGPGFTPEMLGKLGEPYISGRDQTASSSGGLGLGFFIAKTFVERLGGVVDFGNLRPPVNGAFVRARWPLERIRAPER